jgi:hypothetical protein
VKPSNGQQNSNHFKVCSGGSQQFHTEPTKLTKQQQQEIDCFNYRRFREIRRAPASGPNEVFLCLTCNKRVAFDTKVLKKGNSKRKRKISLRNNNNVCVTCSEREKQFCKMYLKNNELTSQFDRDRSRDIENDRVYTISVDVARFLQDHFGSSLNVEDWKVYSSIPVRVIELGERDGNAPLSTMKERFVGGKVTQRDFSQHPNVIRRGVGEILLIIFPRAKDFIAVFDSGHSFNDVTKISLREMVSIDEKERSPRDGAAGGIKLPETQSRSMSRVTQGPEATMFASGPKGTAMGVAYRNDNGQVKYYGSVYNDLLMDRLSKEDKTMEARNYPSYRRVLIQEMRTALVCVAVLCYIGFAPFSRSKIWLPWLKCHYDPEKNFDDLLLDWALSSGEMRNHQACFAHIDGNKSEGIECLSVLGRIDPSGTRNKLATNTVNGYLYFPLDRFVLEINTNTDTIHCKLENTIHLPDPSRDIKNWSRVHGPPY